MKKAIVFIVLIGFTAALGAQSVADLARREKARRQSLGPRRSPIITNIDLLRSKKKAAIDVPAQVMDLDEFYAQAESDEAEGVLPTETGPPPAPAPAPAPPPAAAAPAEAPVKPAEGPSLDDQLKAVQDQIDLLTTKIAALQQTYRAQESMVPNYVIEQQLTETLDRLRNAEVQEIRLKAEIDRRERERRISAGSVR